ncbi:hypothetical protein B0H10DRAFT_1944398 [Mycena sp. CBHHK59/15]|nr:hypothetical protein B0H10DRAFT_1944398 [Mycena sp. CBHHK59/15]
MTASWIYHGLLTTVSEVTDDDGEEHLFQINDVIGCVSAAVLSPGMEDIPIERHWLVKIKEIGSTEDGEVWVQINWYYTPQDVKEKVPTFDAAHCSANERIYSNHSEVISSLTFEVVTMSDFIEDSPEQLPIPSDSDKSFFCQYFFNTEGTAFSVHRYIYTSDTPHPTSPSRDESRIEVRVAFGSNNCFCGQLYVPADMDLQRVMHWCPRPRCRRAYHHICLLNKGHYVRVSGIEEIQTARLASSPETDDNTALPDNWTTFLPAELVGLAAQPIVRGGEFGIAGNVAAVVLARRLVHATLQERCRSVDSDADSDFEFRSDLSRWADRPGFGFWEDAIVESNVSALRASRSTGDLVVLDPRDNIASCKKNRMLNDVARRSTAFTPLIHGKKLEKNEKEGIGSPTWNK